MVKLNKIYTRTGDKGTTGLGDGSRRRKDDLRVEAYGTVDEANCAIGLARLSTQVSDPVVDAMLIRIPVSYTHLDVYKRQIPDEAPRIALVGGLAANARGSLTLNYKIEDDYGVVAAEARFFAPSLNGLTLKGRSLFEPPRLPLVLPNGPGGCLLYTSRCV